MEKRKRIYLIIFSAVVLITAFCVYEIIGIQDSLAKLKIANVGDVNLSLIDDGDYYGEYSVFPVSVKLIVTVKDHAITTINILEHKTGQGQDAVQIIDEVIDSQSLQVDSIAGATYSSKVILFAIKDALG